MRPFHPVPLPDAALLLRKSVPLCSARRSLSNMSLVAARISSATAVAVIATQAHRLSQPISPSLRSSARPSRIALRSIASHQ